MKWLWEFGQMMFWMVAMIPLALVMGVAAGIYGIGWMLAAPFRKTKGEPSNTMQF